MSETVNLPALGESVTEGTVTRWLKNVGDRVEVDEPLLEVSTDKVDTEIPSPVAGVIEEILVAEDETAEVGAALVRIGDGSGSDSQQDDGGSAANQEAPAQEAPAEEAPAPAAEEVPAADEGSSAGSGDGTEVTLPALGESVTEGTVTRWLKAVGDDVEMDEPLLEVSTDKVDTEIPSPVAGKLLEIRVNEDDTAEVGAVLAVIGSGAGAPAKAEPKEAEPVAAASKDEREAPAVEPEKQEAPKQEAPKQESPKQEAPKAEAPKQESPKAEASNDGGTYVTPLVRKLANEHGVDLSTLKGSGVAGRIRKQDVLEAAEAKKSAAPQPAAAPASSSAASDKAAPAKISDESAKLRGTTVKAPRIRQTIARRMVESLQVSAQLTQVQEVDMTRIAKLRASAKNSFLEQNGAKLTFLPFIAKAVTEALKQHPKLNASYDSDAQQITYHDAEHLAIAVDTEKGLLVPVIADAGDLNIAGLAKRIGDVGSRTKAGKIGPDELSGGTFTITNIGSVGALFDTPIINQPQVGILGTGAIVKRPVVLTDAEGNDTIAIRSMMYLSLSYDHRLVDGADAGRFLQTLKARLEEGNFEADLGL
ncbi:2-oxoglutarate dehydrogenase, E2 component, dihydrolipoamide succinyltransferase [Arthrobacter sp. zg-Y20]|uniref:2-oxoglutarate dehydrogenase, E2 component, dihydrolipoamide succinyltransferase n=1 Tax=unclassified Arthrobacter TaxID=235627 RepID=UPI001D141E6B|nr:MULTISPECIES: 2-oxoglutarate dehydrogenase, E2 component, dihydrolipoamide succinyltransferase [unclassified Arthrobacter]MCC3274379.1 2-oxoglutarate dehydrogenase, E2 component, dihydrolipoamide succinyltransferase [Arthrobacter sp. zg-Y20]MDK1314535.1 2-oxoglutarate dehydrogenase, E2 component, dihydrolipoamide succinyltransferase [Arthrobacter sp. zg.Y20]WIB07518.1 2-oxoglutarate dehydrogenase, E2 component, dihydrolipoamide succinyltransferase [Arthrobacter sp. zg-Y20]